MLRLRRFTRSMTHQSPTGLAGGSQRLHYAWVIVTVASMICMITSPVRFAISMLVPYFDCLYGLIRSNLLYISHFCDSGKHMRHRRSVPWKRDTPFVNTNCLPNVRSHLRFSSRSFHGFTPL